jgi:methyl-accepting chemotaxis protein
MNAKTGLVNRAAGEVRSGSEMIVKAIDRIKEIAKANARQVAGLDGAMDVLFKQSETVKKEIEKFRTDKGATEGQGS